MEFAANCAGKPALLAAMLLLAPCPHLVALPQSPPQTPPAADLKALSLEELSQIEVTSLSKEPVRAFRTPAAIYVITGDDIRRSGVTSIPEALRLAPGVEVARIDGSKWAIGIRGFGTRLSRSVLVLIDGRTVYTPLFAGTYWEVQDSLLEDIDRIEVVRGPGGAIWGPNAVNGVINIITKSAKDTHGAYASAGGGNQEQGFANGRYGGATAGGLNYRVYAKGFTRGPEYHPDGRSFDDWRGGQGGFRMDWGDRADAFTVEGDFYGENVGERVQVVNYTAPYETNVDANADLSGGNFLVKWQRKLHSGGDLQLQAYYDRTNRFEPNLAERRNTFDVDFVAHSPLPFHQQLTWGAGLRFSHADNPFVTQGLLFLPPQRTDNLYTAFLQDELGLVENRLSLTVGTKLLRTNFTGFEFEPSARLAWTPSQQETFWAAYTHAVRTPSDAEEDFFLSGFTGQIVNGLPFLARFNANPNFAPEQMNGFELGYRRLLGKSFLIDLASFYNHYHDLFDEELAGAVFLEDTPPPPHLLLPAQFRNGLLATTRGVEVAPEWRPAERWRVRGTYSYLYMNVSKEPRSGDIGTAPGIVGASPQHEATVDVSFDFSKALQFDFDYRYVGQLPAQLVPSYSTADARFAWRFNGGLEIALVANNLFQPHHPEYAGDPGPLVGIRRSGYLQLTWRR